jgi:hypothetical protein
MTMQLAPDRLALPPPFDLDLVDASRAVGWIADNAVGFRGFEDETEAAHAAWVAHRTMARRLARTHGLRPVPVDVEPLAIQRVDGKDMILASGRPVAALVRPGPDSRSGVDSFGFELLIPTPVTELEARAMAYLVYRTLRKSGIRWALWRPDALPVAEASAVRTSVDTATDATETIDAERTDVTDRPNRAGWKALAVPSLRAPNDLTTVLAALALAAVTGLVVGVGPFVTTTLAAVLLAVVMLVRSRRVR